MERRPIDIEACAGKYEVTEDGQVYSFTSEKFLKPSVHKLGYIKYALLAHKGSTFNNGNPKRVFSAHRLVAFAFIGNPPSEYHTDCHHKDHDKSNNHHSNLEWTTHSENLLRSYRDTDRVGWKKGKTFGPHSPETIALMRRAKEKKCFAEQNGDTKEYLSVQDLLDDLGIYRKAFNRAVRSGAPYKGITLGYLNH